MYDRALAREILRQIHDGLLTISQRFEPVKAVEDFTGSPGGKEKLDAICMLLIAVGESLKNLDKLTNGTLLSKYPQVDWKKAKGLRDILSHHYFDVDAEAIFRVCERHIGRMRRTIRQIMAELE